MATSSKTLLFILVGLFSTACTITVELDPGWDAGDSGPDGDQELAGCTGVHPATISMRQVATFLCERRLFLGLRLARCDGGLRSLASLALVHRQQKDKAHPQEDSDR